MPREDARTKANRLLLAGAVTVVYVKGRLVRAIVKGESGSFHDVHHEVGSWSCSCPALRGSRTAGGRPRGGWGRDVKVAGAAPPS